MLIAQIAVVLLTISGVLITTTTFCLLGISTYFKLFGARFSVWQKAVNLVVVTLLGFCVSGIGMVLHPCVGMQISDRYEIMWPLRISTLIGMVIFVRSVDVTRKTR